MLEDRVSKNKIRWMEFDIDHLSVKVIRSNRRTMSIEVKAEGVLVRAPRRMSDREIREVLLKKSAWIEKHQKKLQERQNTSACQKPYTEEEIRALAEQALDVIPKKVKQYAPLVGVDYGRITIRNQRTRWGSCSEKGNLNFNCLLMLLPDDVIDSVIVHELCHRKHMNHSARFYEEVERVFPEYQRCHRWLKENGGVYLSRLP